MTVKLIHTSDWQIGKVFRFLDTATIGLVQEARLRTISRLGELAGVHGATHVLARLPQLAHDFDDFSSFDSRNSLILLSPIFVIPL